MTFYEFLKSTTSITLNSIIHHLIELCSGRLLAIKKKSPSRMPTYSMRGHYMPKRAHENDDFCLLSIYTEITIKDANIYVAWEVNTCPKEPMKIHSKKSQWKWRLLPFINLKKKHHQGCQHICSMRGQYMPKRAHENTCTKEPMKMTTFAFAVPESMRSRAIQYSK